MILAFISGALVLALGVLIGAAASQSNRNKDDV